MLKNFKMMLVLGVSIFVLPLYVRADNNYTKISCVKTELIPGETTTCNISLDVTGTNFGVDSFTASLRAYENDGNTSTQKITLGNYEFDTSNWPTTSNDSIDDGNYVLVIGDDAQLLTGNIAIGSFKVTAGNDTGTFKVGLKNISYGTSTDELEESPVFVQISIVQQNNVDNNDNTNTGTDTNTDTNTSDNTDTNNDKNTDTKKEEPVSPDTGVSISLLGIGALVLGGISYIVLKNKNYFNRI